MGFRGVLHQQPRAPCISALPFAMEQAVVLSDVHGEMRLFCDASGSG